MNRKFLTIKMKIRQFGIALLCIGGVLFINNIPFSTLVIVFGALLFVVNYFLSSFDEIKKDPNWELAFPELALGVGDENKVEYEQCISGKHRIFYRIFYLNKSIFIVSLSMKFFILTSPKIHLNDLDQITTLFLIMSSLILFSFYIISIFEPISLKPNWSLVFPELKEKIEKK
jgi:hypothetical protein